jgi:HPt (histidine-containing phosphotransfer) domain-containing protein
MMLQPNPQIYQLEEAIRAYGSEAVVKEALRSFLTTSENLPERLRQSWQSRDTVQFRKTLHWLKGGLSYLHAPRLKVACLELDALVQQETWPDLTAAIDHLNEELARLVECARDYLGSSE